MRSQRRRCWLRKRARPGNRRGLLCRYWREAFLLGLIRSGLLYRAKIGRALAIEGMLFVVATSVAQLLAGSTVQSYGLAVRGFFLVESAFFLLEGARPRAGSGSAEDPFERARREATRLMEEQPG